jgi:hypothetical protein
MQSASTGDLVLADIADIQQTPLHPAPGFHLPPTHVYALKQLTEALASVSVTDNDHTLSPKTDTHLRADSLHIIASSIEMNVPPLRVVTSTIVLPNPAIGSPKVHFAPSPSEVMQPTYHKITGSQHCCIQRTTPGQLSLTLLTPHPRQTIQ